MVYLVIKELSKEAEDVIMVTSSIMKDTSATGQGEIYRANAIRALCRIIDVRDRSVIGSTVGAVLTGNTGIDGASNRA